MIYRDERPENLASIAIIKYIRSLYITTECDRYETFINLELRDIVITY